MPKIKILDFPVIRQSTRYSCSCASLQACLCYYGIDQREKQLIDQMHINKETLEIHPIKIVKMAKKYGLKARYKKLSIDSLIYYINNNIPVIINFQAWSRAATPDYTTDNNGHYAVVIGYDRNKRIIVFSDPSSYNKCYMPYDELNLRWHDGLKEDYDYDHRGIVIWGLKPQFNSKKIVRLE